MSSRPIRTLAAASALAALCAAPAARAEVEPERPVPGTSFALIENAGQWDTPAVLVGRLGGIRAELLPGAVRLRLAGPGLERAVELRLTLEGGSERCTPRGQSPRPESRSFFTGPDPSRWRACVPSYAQALYEDLRPGVDLRLRESGGRLEWDLLLDPGVDAEALVLVCEGADDVALGAGGELVLETALGPVRMGRPTSWSVGTDGSVRPLPSGYRRIDARRFGFELAGRDEGLALVIDPGIEWATYLGGTKVDVAARVERGPNGRIYLCGATDSANFPAAGGLQSTKAGNRDCFLSILDATGTTLLHSTYFGGSSGEGIYDMDIGPGGEVVVTGWTYSANFPIAPGAFQSVKGTGCEAFVARFDADLTALEHSTFLGDAAGTGSNDWGSAIEVDPSGDWFVCGFTRSPSFPTTPGAYDTIFNGLTDVFVSRLRPAPGGAMSLLWSTLLGGSDHEGVGAVSPPGGGPYALDLELDAAGRPTLTGSTRSGDFPVTPGAYQTALKGPQDGFVTRLLADGSGLAFSTLFGGSFLDASRSIAVDAGGSSTVSGLTWSSDFPTPGGYDTVFGGQFGDYDAFLAILSPAGDTLTYGTYLGGSGTDEAYSQVVDASGVIAVAGLTRSTNFPTKGCAAQTTHGGGLDGFVLQLDPSLAPPKQQLRYSSLVGGTFDDEALDVELGEAGSLLVCGYSASPDFPVTPGAYDTTANGDWDAVVLSLDPLCPAAASIYCTAGVSASGCQAALSAVGVASATASSGFELAAAGVEGAKDGLLFFGTGGRQANPWGNGTSFQCVVPPVKRAGLLAGVGTPGACDGAFQQDLNAHWCPSCPKPGHNPGVGATVQAQLWYRDPLSTSNQTTSLSDALEFPVGP